MKNRRHAASFRDPAGHIMLSGTDVFRQINPIYKDNYDRLVASGLYSQLVKKGWLVEHREIETLPISADDAYKILKVSRIPFISYPYEWCFSQLKAAALLTLAIQEAALECGMSLKDASAYNVQFQGSKPIFIDTLSFEVYQEGRAWDAYRQFCQHFLAPLAAMAKTDIRLGQLLGVHIDGLPLDLASSLLPLSSWFMPGTFLHVHIHSRMQRRFSQTDDESATVRPARIQLSKSGLKGIVNSLRKTVESLVWDPTGTEWGEYYQSTNYSDTAFEAKEQFVTEYLARTGAKVIWDLGANTGRFSKLAATGGASVIAFDIDPGAVELHYQTLQREPRLNSSAHILPLVLDLTNPSPGSGWAHEERSSLIARGPADCVMALALVHHLAIGNNIPLDVIASFFSRICTYLIIEFVPKSDGQISRLLMSRRDIFTRYSMEDFEIAFAGFFSTIRCDAIAGTDRRLYLMKRTCRSL